jgi:hypothetical protein
VTEQKVVIIDTGCANVSSVKFAIERLGYDVTISKDPQVVLSADKLFLPGVGTASEAMKNLEERDLINLVKQVEKPLLGICLGMQLLGKFSQEKGQKADELVGEGWHYCADVPNGPLTCQYIFVLDALNFCFWPTPGLEYDYLATCLRKVLENDSTAFSAENLSSISSTTLASWFPEYSLPELDERVLRLNELGEALSADFDGLAQNIVRAAEGSAVCLVRLILQYIPGFRDTSVYKGRLVHFYKRAQILVGDLWAAYGRSTESADGATGNCYNFTDLAELTMFADYRVPQILRQMNVLRYSDALINAIDTKTELPFGSEEEIEIRACTVVAVERLQEALSRSGVNVLVIEVDWLLWQIGEKTKDDIPPHHRTRTIYY